MSQPTDEHTNAEVVAAAVILGLEPHEDTIGFTRLLLESTHPTVLDALEAALTRAGRLTEERCCDQARRELREDGGTRYVICGSYGGGETCRRRLVTEWREDEP